MELQEKTISGEFFINIIENKGDKLVKFRPTFFNFFLGPYCAGKIHTSTFICCMHPGKEAGPLTNHKKKRYGIENSGCFVFGKPVLFTLGVGLTKPYSLGILV